MSSSSSSSSSAPKQFSSFKGIFSNFSPFSHPGFKVGHASNVSLLQDETRILVVGAGGLGCEILKNLALSGFRDIHVIDMDKVDVSNLNRQFLFRETDLDKYKAQVAADFVMKRCPGVNVQYHTSAIQDFKTSFYAQFNVVIAGLDNIEARRWLNQTLIDLVTFDADFKVNPDSVIPLIDGGTEAFNGQSRVFIPRITSCFECSLASLTPPTGYPMCTIRNVPRIPEHCITYALKVQWPLLISFKSPTEYTMKDKGADDDTAQSAVELDKDDENHMTWLYNRALERAEHYKISGVTYNLTMQVVKNIIPAIGSTNALVAAACVNEAFKYITRCARSLDNYYMYRGAEQTGIYAETIKYDRNESCNACSTPVFRRLSPSTKLSALRDDIAANCDVDNPDITKLVGGVALYQVNFHDSTKGNLDKSLAELDIQSDTLLIFNGKNFATATEKKSQKVFVRFTEK